MENFITFDSHTKKYTCQGRWDLRHLTKLKVNLASKSFPTSGDVLIDASDITHMDSAGAWLFIQWMDSASEKGLKVQLQNISEHHQKLISLIKEQTRKKAIVPKVEKLSWLATLGKSSLDALYEIRDYFSFIGELASNALWILVHPSHMRWREVAGLVYKAGYQALPIIALLSFMVGVVLAHESGVQLQKYGANIFLVDLVGYSVLREFGPLITAIMVAGRTGSAFTAQLGIMKINQEIDALNTMSVTPTELLLLPRVVALLIVLPLLTIWADIFSVLGGLITTTNILNSSWLEFLHRFQLEVPMRELLVGLGKTPIFALIIASIGCFQGMNVERNADSVGRLTTRSVVLSIFFIVVADAVFSVLFSKFELL